MRLDIEASEPVQEAPVKSRLQVREAQIARAEAVDIHKAAQRGKIDDVRSVIKLAPQRMKAYCAVTPAVLADHC